MADNYNIKIDTQVQLEEIKALLTELRSISAEMSKINGLTFSAVSVSAAELSKTTKDLAEALKAQKDAVDNLPTSTEKASDGIRKLGESIEKNEKEIDRAKTATQGFYMELGAMCARLATQIPSVLTASIKAFGEEEVAVQKLSAAIRANGGDASAVVPIYKEFASEMQRATVFADDQILAIQGVATSMGVLPSQMQQVIQGAIGLSSALGMDLQTATRASAAAVQGKTELLTRYIPMLSECKTEEEKFAKVQELSRSGFAQAKAEADSTLGKLKQCANAWGDLSEVVGGMFAPIATDVATLLKSMCEWLSSNKTEASLLTGTLTTTAVALSFAKIGGLANVAGLMKNLAFAIMGVKGASDALNLSIKANPIGVGLTVAATALTAITSAYSYFKGKAEETYKENIKQSKEYRDALDAEMDSIKQWGLSYDANSKRVKELNKEIAKYETLLEMSKTRVFGESLEELTARTDNYKAKIEKLREVLGVLSNAQELNKLASDRQREALKKSEEILRKNAEELEVVKTKTSELEYVRKQYKDTETKIVNLDKEFKSGNIAVSERVAKASALASARKQLVELAESELALMLEINKADNETKKTSALQSQYALEKQIAEAVSSGNIEKSKELQKELASVHAHQQKLELANTYFDSLKAAVKSQDDISKLQKEANAYADSMLKKKEAEAQIEKWLNAESEASKEKQRSLDLEILRARASGNEAQAKELEGKLRIAQLTNEIFEASRKEGMSKQELVNLQESASKQAQERYNLEKSITEEAERQNLAKNAQAKIEDIIIAHKIEQLKAEGKLAEAKELEQEREIKRTLAGLGDVVSDDDKKKLGNMMRSTNDFRNKQQEKSSGMRGGSFDSETSSVISRKNSLMSGGSGGRTLSSSRQRGKPATVSDKYADLYSEYQEAKKAGTAKDGWNAFRDQQSKSTPKPNLSKVRVQAGKFLEGVESTSQAMTGQKQAQAPKKAEPPTKPKQAASTALNNKLNSMGANGKASGNEDSSIANALKDMQSTLKSIDNNVKALGSSKKGNE